MLPDPAVAVVLAGLNGRLVLAFDPSVADWQGTNTASTVTGVLSVVTPCLGIPLAVAALVLAYKARRLAAPTRPTMVGIVCGWVTVGLHAVAIAVMVAGLPATLGQGQVIAGWDEGLIGVKVGERRRVVIGAAKAYGAQGLPDGSIPPNTSLAYEVDVVQIGH